MKKILVLLTVTFFVSLIGCKNKEVTKSQEIDSMAVYCKTQVDNYFVYDLKADLSNLSENERKMLPILFDAAKIMDDLYWQIACGSYRTFYDSITDSNQKRLFEINYGPWNRLDGNKSFVEGVGSKPKGAFFYPIDMTENEFNQLNDANKTSLYTVIKRDSAGKLIVVPYSVAFKDQLQKAADLLQKAAEFCDDKDFKNYLLLRAKALTTDDYFASDMAWMNSKNNKIEFVIGPIENYEDAMFGYKAAFESYILIKDIKWSQMLAKYTKLLPQLQKQLPVDEKYKKETPGDASDLYAYDIVYYAGDCNAGSKTIAINLPNDEKVQLSKGSRRLQLKNAMKAKFDSIVMPISNVILTPEQRKYVSFDAFFANTMFHEVAHGLGIKNTLTGKGTCREALKDVYSTFEEGKADILGLWLINQLISNKQYEADYNQNLVTFATGIFRSIRFGASSSHGKANLICYNFFMEQGALNRDANGIYTVDLEKIKLASDSLARLIITIQGDGDYAKAQQIMKKYMVMTDNLKADLDKINNSKIPVDVVWHQGLDVLGIK